MWYKKRNRVYIMVFDKAKGRFVSFRRDRWLSLTDEEMTRYEY